MEAPSVSRDDHQKDEDNIVTMVDVLNEEAELEEHANAVLGSADDKICTYSKGYILRQPLYACATCNPPEGGNLAGICLACSFRCHEGHELTELYTKRNFRCDCGNSLFPNNKCSLEPIKEALNEKNNYNQNFKGTYCTCKRPYPDPDDTVQDEMIQCILCEDWFHKRHLDLTNPKCSDFGEMVCLECMSKYSFLWEYTALYGDHIKNKMTGDSGNISVGDLSNEAQVLQNHVNINQNQGACHLLRDGAVEVGKGSTFWPDGWRKNLCQCANCLKMYEDKNISFLLNEMDTVQHYEAKNKENAKETQYERGLKALSTLDRIKQVEAIEGYNQMETELMGYLQKFAENKKVVREEDIWEFFDKMGARKKQKVEIPHFCR